MNNSELQRKISSIVPTLVKNEVHVWQASLNVGDTILHALERTLSEEEIIKARRFHFEKDQHHFIVARGVLRTLLGRYLNTDPRLLRFEYNDYGKPSLGYPFE